MYKMCNLRILASITFQDNLINRLLQFKLVLLYLLPSVCGKWRTCVAIAWDYTIQNIINSLGSCMNHDAFHRPIFDSSLNQHNPAIQQFFQGAVILYCLIYLIKILKRNFAWCASKKTVAFIAMKISHIHQLTFLTAPLYWDITFSKMTHQSTRGLKAHHVLHSFS